MSTLRLFIPFLILTCATTLSAQILQNSALTVLEGKCNDCHRKDKPRKVFTLDNMDKEARSIYRQVFVRERMPKKDAPPLTREEKGQLEAWLRKVGEFKN